jgi:hypothetical protein
LSEGEALLEIWAGVPNRRESRRAMAQNHYVTKAKRRNKSKNRKDPAATTMAKLRERAAAEAKKSAK